MYPRELLELLVWSNIMKKYLFVALCIGFIMVSCEDLTKEDPPPVPDFLQGTWRSENWSQFLWHYYKFTENKVQHYYAFRYDIGVGMTVSRNDNFEVDGVYLENGIYRISRRGDSGYMTNVVFSDDRTEFIFKGERFLKSN
jgi:hypothetical protein